MSVDENGRSSRTVALDGLSAAIAVVRGETGWSDVQVRSFVDDCLRDFHPRHQSFNMAAHKLSGNAKGTPARKATFQ